MREIERAAASAACSAIAPFDRVGVLNIEGHYVLRVAMDDTIELRVRHRKARNRIGVVRLAPTADFDTVVVEVTKQADAIAGLPPFTMWAYAFDEDPDDPASPWQVGVHVDHEEGAERSGSVTGLMREQAIAIADAFNLAAALLVDIQRTGVP